MTFMILYVYFTHLETMKWTFLCMGQNVLICILVWRHVYFRLVRVQLQSHSVPAASVH